MTYYLVLGIIVSFFIFGAFDEDIFAVETGTKDDSLSNFEEKSNLDYIQSFEADTTPPYIKIINPTHCPPNFVNGTIIIEGIARDSEKVKMVEAFVHAVPLEGEIYFEPATPIAPDDWSKWSIPLTIPDNSKHRILVHAYDYSGNEEWDESLVNTNRAKMNAQAIDDKSKTKIAFVEPTFTNAAYNLDSFYFFYSKYYSTPSDQEVTTDLDLLTGDIPLEFETGYFQNIFDTVKQSLPNSFVTVIGDEEIHYGDIFKEDGQNMYDVLIFLHNEYATQKYYENVKKFLENGGSIVFLTGNNFYAEVKFDDNLCTATLVKGHDWEFDGNSAKPSVSERFLDENSEWFGSNYIVNALDDDVIFENNPFEYTHFEENYVTNSNAEILLDYKVKFAQTEEKQTNPFVVGGILKDEFPIEYSNEGKTVATYELSSGNGKVIHLGLYAQGLDTNPVFLNYFEKIILPRALDKSYQIKSNFDLPVLYWMLPGGGISDVSLEPEQNTLRMKVNFTPSEQAGIDESYLTVVIPKKMLDAHVENKMKDFVVTSNGIQIPYEEASDDVERGLKIKITEDSDIEIVGTSAVPEFNLSMIVLASSICVVLLILRLTVPSFYSFSKIN